MASHHTWRVWLLALVPDVRFGRWLSAFLLFVSLYGAFWLCRVFEEGDDPAQAAALFFSIIIAYIVPVYHLITEHTQAAFAEVEPELKADAERIRVWRDRIDRKSHRWTWSVLAIGVGAGLAHNVVLAGSPALLLHRFASSAGAALVIGAMLVWIVMMFVVVALLDNARLFNRLAAHVTVNLIDSSRLTAFARVAVASTLALVGAQAAFPLLVVAPNSSAIAMIPGMFATATPMLFLLALPIWPVRRAIAAAKAVELKRINARLRMLNGDTSDLNAVNPLLAYRREIASVSEWPFNAGVTTRLVFYLVIPPLTWIAAGLIDVLIERLV